MLRHVIYSHVAHVEEGLAVAPFYFDLVVDILIAPAVADEEGAVVCRVLGDFARLQIPVDVAATGEFGPVAGCRAFAYDDDFASGLEVEGDDLLAGCLLAGGGTAECLALMLGQVADVIHELLGAGCWLHGVSPYSAL